VEKNALAMSLGIQMIVLDNVMVVTQEIEMNVIAVAILHLPMTTVG